jgi:tetratricopeptide (TPR) repeat protein
MSLNNVAAMLRQLGRREEALAAAQEAVTLRRALAGKRPEAFEPNLAMSLNNVATMLSDLGRREEALAAAQEAVDVLAPHFQSSPQAFSQWMSIACANYVRRCRENGRAPRSDLKPLIGTVLGKKLAVAPTPDIPAPHPAADPERAVRLNMEYQERVRQWRALPWLKRKLTKPPEPPTGV